MPWNLFLPCLSTLHFLFKKQKENLLLRRPISDLVFFRAEVNSRIKFVKCTAEARRLNQAFELAEERGLN